MVFTCAVFGCRSGYKRKKGEDGNPEENSKFAFPDEPELQNKWIRFVCRENYKVTSSSRICDRHFDEKYIKRGIRDTLRRFKPHTNNLSHRNSGIFAAITGQHSPTTSCSYCCQGAYLSKRRTNRLSKAGCHYLF